MIHKYVTVATAIVLDTYFHELRSAGSSVADDNSSLWVTEGGKFTLWFIRFRGDVGLRSFSSPCSYMDLSVWGIEESVFLCVGYAEFCSSFDAGVRSAVEFIPGDVPLSVTDKWWFSILDERDV